MTSVKPTSLSFADHNGTTNRNCNRQPQPQLSFTSATAKFQPHLLKCKLSPMFLKPKSSVNQKGCNSERRQRMLARPLCMSQASRHHSRDSALKLLLPSQKCSQRRAAPLFAPRCASRFRQMKTQFHAMQNAFCVEAPAHMYMLVVRVVVFCKVGDTISDASRRYSRRAALHNLNKEKSGSTPYKILSALKLLLICICW